ncbi:MAG: pirin family protein [Thermoplasmata archaeon]
MSKTEIKILNPRRIEEGAGADVLRLFPGPDIEHFDPFVLMDEFFVEAGAGFPMHKHAGFEAITYMIEGGFRHKDNLGNDSKVDAGGIQKFNAGDGIKHEEMPVGETGSHGFQLWVNLPMEYKDSEPTYQKVESDEVPEWESEGIKVRTVVGEGSPIGMYADMLFLDVHLEEGAEYDMDIPNHFHGILYTYEGSMKVNGKMLDTHHAMFVKDKSEFQMMTDEDTKFIIIAGEPLEESINIRGSIVE